MSDTATGEKSRQVEPVGICPFLQDTEHPFVAEPGLSSAASSVAKTVQRSPVATEDTD